MVRKLKLGMRKKPAAKVPTNDELSEGSMGAAVAEQVGSPRGRRRKR